MIDPRLNVTPRIFGIYEGKLVSWFNHWRGDDAPAQALHKGWDVVAPYRTNIRALGRCRVVRKRDHGSVRGYNQEVTVYDPEALVYILYGHVAAGIPHDVGDVLEAGDIIATVGTSKDAMWTAPHAHIQCWKSEAAMWSYTNSMAIDPQRVRDFYKWRYGKLL